VWGYAMAHGDRSVDVFVRKLRAKLEKLSQMFDAGKLRVEIEDVLPLEEAAEAHERVEAGHTRGKIVLRIG
jgi:NADPH:quinone reductase-like Zn-dependent oxidoreductase